MSDNVMPKKILLYMLRIQNEYESQGRILEKKLIDAVRVYIREGVDYDNLNGGTYIHHVILFVPLETAKAISVENEKFICKEICEKLTHFSGSIENECIGRVVLEINDPDDPEFQKSNPVIRYEEENYSHGENAILKGMTREDLARIWGDLPLRVFLSHKDAEKVRATEIKTALSQYGVACFVAHEDIEVTQEWQDEIECALMTTHILVPILTENFNDSEWTDQEVGAAIGRGVLIVPVRMGKDPYGFIGKYQGMVGTDRTPADIACDLYGIFLENEKTKELAKESFLYAAKNSRSFDESNRLGRFLSKIESFSGEQIDRLCQIYRDNSQIWDSNVFRAGLNQGLIYHLNRITGDTYVVDRNRIITKENTESASADLYDEIPF